MHLALYLHSKMYVLFCSFSGAIEHIASVIGVNLFSVVCFMSVTLIHFIHMLPVFTIGIEQCVITDQHIPKASHRVSFLSVSLYSNSTVLKIEARAIALISLPSTFVLHICSNPITFSLFFPFCFHSRFQ